MKSLKEYSAGRGKFIQINVPTVLTIFRVFSIPFLILFYCLNTEWHYLIAGAIFAIACVTDWLDGFLARKLKQTSAFGAFLDPVADKLIVAVALMLIVSASHLHNVLLPAIVIVGREIAVSSLREMMSEIGKRASIMVNRLGKLKTVFQMLALGILLAVSPSSPKIIVMLGYILLYLAAFFTIISMFIYLKMAWIELATRDI